MYSTSVHNKKIYQKYNAFFLDMWNVQQQHQQQLIQKYLNLTQQCLISVIGLEAS